MNHLELIVKDGTVKIPSLFMFKNIIYLDAFLEHAKTMNCTVIFENEGIELPPHWEDIEVRFLFYIYRSMIMNPNIANSYLRYLGNIDKMSWENCDNEGTFYGK